MTLVRGHTVESFWLPHQSWSLGSIPTISIAPGTTVLPTTNPGAASAQFIHTLVAADFPVLPSGWTCDWQLVAQAGGQNNDGSTRSISMDVYQNGTLVRNFPVTAAAGALWSIGTEWKSTPFAVGDVVAISLWASSSVACSWDEVIIQLWPTHLRPNWGVGPWFMPELTSVTLGTLGDVSVSGVTNTTLVSLFQWSYQCVTDSTTPVAKSPWLIHASNGLGGSYYGEITGAASSSTSRLWWRYYGPTSWSGRLSRIRWQ